MSLRALGLAFVLASFAPRAAIAAEPALIEVDGPELLRQIRSLGAKLVILNVWATWCAPCKEEFPDLLELERGLAPLGARLVFVTTDAPSEHEAAERFLRDQKVRLPSYAQRGKEAAFIEAIHPEWSGTLPATFLFDSHGKCVAHYQGRIDPRQLEKRARAVLTGEAKQR
jgi:thiol-disulfide isomerase/thioredoxin